MESNKKWHNIGEMEKGFCEPEFKVSSESLLGFRRDVFISIESLIVRSLVILDVGLTIVFRNELCRQHRLLPSSQCGFLFVLRPRQYHLMLS